jgi:predicted DCC family thiol-disulfide oxidoreductase YuxK
VTDPKTLVLYDGRCPFCNRVVWFILRRDHHDRFRFAPLQSSFAKETLARHRRDATALDTLYALPQFGTPSEQVLSKGRAALRVLREIGGMWRLALVFAVLPNFVLDFVYDWIARRRMHLAGSADACPVPTAGERAKFIGLEEGPAPQE